MRGWWLKGRSARRGGCGVVVRLLGSSIDHQVKDMMIVHELRIDVALFCYANVHLHTQRLNAQEVSNGFHYE